MLKSAMLPLLMVLISYVGFGQQPLPAQPASALAGVRRPPLPPPPTLPENATAAQQAEYERQVINYERQRWNFVLTDSAARARVLNEQPNSLLMEAIRGRKAGTALDVGMGEGRNTIYLAQQGWQATGIDVADQALAFAQNKARLRGVHITTLEQNADTYDWGTGKWDLIVLSYAGGREYPERVETALKPGGIVVLEGFHEDAAKQMRIGSGVVFGPDELRKLYAAAGLEIVRYEEPMAVADFGKQSVRLVKMVARKPRK